MTGFPPLAAGWSLNYEMFFYLIFGLSLFFKRKRYFFLFGTLLILVFVPLLFMDIQNHKDEIGTIIFPLIVLITDPMLLEFLCGVTIGLLLPKLKFNKITVLGILIFSAVGFVLYYLNFYQFYLSDLVVCGLLVFSVVVLDSSDIKLKVNGMLVYLGDMSYSIYLVHLVIIQLLKMFFVDNTSFGFGSNESFFILTIALTLLSSIILYELIEKRLTNYLRKILLEVK